MTRVSLFGTAVVGLLTVYCTAASAQSAALERQQQRIETIARISPSIVCVMPPGGQGGGSGVLISADGYAISNYHVTSGAGNFMKCGLDDGQVYDAVIVGIDPTGDVALIKLLGREDFSACVPGDSDRVRVGDEVVALGNPFLLASDFTPTVTYGIVSGVHRYQYPANTFLEYTDCIQIDASINPGNSGGPLFDINGRWIGINGRASFEKRGRINSGAAYAISVRQVQLFIEHLKAGRIVDHGRTDFTVATYDDVVEVQQVSELSEVWRRGLRPGDEIVSFGGRALTSANDFKNILGIFPEGARVPLVFRNDDGLRKVTVRLSPLHDFVEAPPLPEERRPRRPQQPEDPEKMPDGHPVVAEEEKPTVPKEYAHLFEEKKGFANFYFNRTATEQLLDSLYDRTGDIASADYETWLMNVVTNTEAGAHTGRLTVRSGGAGLDLAGLEPELQSLNEPEPENESPQLYGLLFGTLQWYRFFTSEPDVFSDITYHGTETLAPSGQLVRVLVVQDGTTTCRWYFDDMSPLPVGVDVQISAGVDEGRLRFADWRNEGGIPVPGRIGVVDADTERIRWVEVDSVEFRNKANAAAVVLPRSAEVQS